MKTHIVFAVVAACLSLSGAASAQNTQLVAQPQVIGAMSVADMTYYFERVGFAVKQDPDFQGAVVLEVTTDTGASFYVAMRGCDANGLCDLLDTFGYFNAGGMSLIDVNKIHGEQMLGSMIVLIENGIGIVAKKIFLEGGVAEANLDTQFTVFFLDITLTATRAQNTVTAAAEGEAEGAAIPVSLNGHALAGSAYGLPNPVVNAQLPKGFVSGYFAPLLSQVAAARKIR